MAGENNNNVTTIVNGSSEVANSVYLRVNRGIGVTSENVVFMAPLHWIRLKINITVNNIKD